MRTRAASDQVTLIEAEPDEGAGGTRILRKTDAAVRQKQPGLDPSDSVFDQGCELLPLLVRNGGPEVLNLDKTLAHENNLRDLVEAALVRKPGVDLGLFDELVY